MRAAWAIQMTTIDATRTLGPDAELALHNIRGKSTRGIPSWLLNVMEHAVIEELAGVEPGQYVKEPESVYLAMQKTLGTCMIDQWIPRNPMSMGAQGYQGQSQLAPTQGAERIVVDGILIDSPEAVVRHMEQVAFPALRKTIDLFNHDALVQKIIRQELTVQTLLGSDILKVPYGVATFPGLDYGRYGYEAYFMAYALYPEVIDEGWRLRKQYAVLHNQAVAHAYKIANLPPLCRLDHDMADSRGPLVDVRSLETRWFPLLAESIEPLLKAGILLIWHCDGNLMPMLPSLIKAGISGFQGFQYEDGMDYPTICRMTTRDGSPLLIIAGVSVTHTLPHGSPEDVRKELRFLVENGPRIGLFLGGSSSIAPATPRENILTLAEGLRYYRDHGREE